jgi:regulator of protease activity HflC (stomatin/prohibitin superfamily)
MFVFLIILLILVVGAWISVPYFKTEAQDGSDTYHPRRYARVTAIVLSGIFVLVLLLGSITTVSTKNVGIETAFGRTSGHLSNGIHLVWPWVSVTEMDAAIQTDSYTRADCLNVRIANQQTACVDISIRWRIYQGAADQLFQNYRTFDNVRDSLVTRELTAALNQQLASYNPLNSIPTATTVAGSNYPTAPSLNAVAADVTAQMRREIGDQGIDVLTSIIPYMSFDAQTQARLNQLQQQEAQTRIAQAELQTNEAQSAANQALAASVQQNPEVLVSKCLDIMNTLVKNGGKPPVGMCALGNAPSVLASGG